MEPRTASTLTDAYSRMTPTHPRLDFSSEEGRRYAMRLAPYLTPLVRPGLRALDLGCSFGKSSFLLCELGASVTGVDVSFGALRFASNLGRTLHSKSVFVRTDYARLPFCRECFELALLPHNVVECSPDEFALVVTETSRVLVAGGIFAVSVSDKWADVSDPTLSLRNTTVTLPGDVTYAYPTYSWSCDAVQSAVSCAFRTVKLVKMPERDGTWMVFSKNP